MENTSQIKAAAVNALENLGRTSFSNEKFSQAQIEAISNAILQAIIAYDNSKQK